MRPHTLQQVRSRFSGYALAGLLGAAAVASGSISQADVVERVVATVNEDAIFLSDLRKRAVPFLPQLEAATSDEERVAGLQRLYQELLALLIDEELIEQMARRSQTRVTDEEVAQAADNQRSHFNMTEEQFWEAVRDQGMSRQEYERTIRKQLLRFKIVNERVRSRINITEDQVRRRYEKQAREQGPQLRFRVSDITVETEGAGTATDVAAARKKAAQIRATLTADNFEEKMAEHEGLELGWVTQGDLADELEDALLTLNPNEISDPIRSGGRFHIFLLHERETGEGLASYEDTKDQIFRELLDSAMRRQEQVFLEELRRKATIRRML